MSYELCALFEAFQQPDRAGKIANVGFAVCVSCAENILISPCRAEKNTGMVAGVDSDGY